MKKRNAKARNGRTNGHLGELIAANTVAALRDESYQVVVGVVEELLKDRSLREEIQEHTRAILRAILARL